MNLATVTRIIDAPIGEVWAMTSSFGSIHAWMPSVAKVSVEGAGIGAVRTVQTNGMEAKETLTVLDPAQYRVRYGITAPGMPFTGFVGGTDLVALDAGTTKIDWVAEAEAVQGDATPIIAYLESFMAESLAGLGAFMKAPMRET